MNLTIGKAMRWWEKGLQPNMREIESAQDLADSLLNAGDKLVVVNFFSPSHPAAREEPKTKNCIVPASELRAAQVDVLQPPCPCPPFLQVVQGSSGPDQEVQGCPREAWTRQVQPRPSTGAGGVKALGVGCEQGPAIQLQQETDLVPIADAIKKEAAAAGDPWLPLPPTATQLFTQGSENSLLSSGRYAVVW